MPAIEMVPATLNAFTSQPRRLTRNMLPATLMTAPISGSDEIQVHISIDNGKSFKQAEDSTGEIKFIVDGKNIIYLDNPMLFILVKTDAASIGGPVSLSFGTDV